MWDCITLLDDETADAVEQRGGLDAIAISHPHYYSGMVEWAQRFDCPIHLHAADREWIMRPDAAIKLWDGETLPLLPDVTLIRCGGHFPGGTVLHWAKGAGILCSADIATVTTDRKFLTFMRSYPNFIPLSAREVEGIAAALEPFAFDVIYGHYFDRVIARDAKQVLKASVARYLAAISGTVRRG
jgi:glyoxylase-like metal-dependent hydrolase (beta-lactamase superfamily II)